MPIVHLTSYHICCTSGPHCPILVCLLRTATKSAAGDVEAPGTMSPARYSGPVVSAAGLCSEPISLEMPDRPCRLDRPGIDARATTGQRPIKWGSPVYDESGNPIIGCCSPDRRFIAGWAPWRRVIEITDYSAHPLHPIPFCPTSASDYNRWSASHLRIRGLHG